jgi:hypothetical protein
MIRLIESFQFMNDTLICSDWLGKGSERRKSLHRKSKKEHRKSKTSLLDQNVESIFLN